MSTDPRLAIKPSTIQAIDKAYAALKKQYKRIEADFFAVGEVLAARGFPSPLPAWREATSHIRNFHKLSPRARHRAYKAFCRGFWSKAKPS